LYEVDPLICAGCGGEMRVVALITEPSVIKKILDHLRRRVGRGVRRALLGRQERRSDNTFRRSGLSNNDPVIFDNC
jgi:hypothetical protein